MDRRNFIQTLVGSLVVGLTTVKTKIIKNNKPILKNISEREILWDAEREFYRMIKFKNVTKKYWNPIYDNGTVIPNHTGPYGYTLWVHRINESIGSVA